MYDTNEMVYTLDDVIAYSKIENVLQGNDFPHGFDEHENLYKIYWCFHRVANESRHHLGFLYNKIFIFLYN
jgi:hypothetical protein